MIDLDRALIELADRLEVPGGDRLVTDVMRRIGEPARPLRAPRRRFVVAFAAAVVLALVVAALPGPRHAIARWLGFDSVRIEPGVTVPTSAVPSTTASTSASTTSSMPASSGPPATSTTVAAPDLGLGQAMSVDAAVAASGLPDPSAAVLGEPQSAHVVHPPAAGQIVLVYAPSDLLPQSSVIGVGALVSVIPAHLEDGYFGKMLGDSATVQPVTVDGTAGYWIEGSPHQVLFESGGQFDNDTLRLATNTLLWQRGDYLYRLEADISLESALRIAASIEGT